jgi:hypothetical protein
VYPVDAEKEKKGAWCWKCSVDSHASKDCKVPNFCYICNNLAHPAIRCPVLKTPRPTAFVVGVGMYET